MKDGKNLGRWPALLLFFWTTFAFASPPADALRATHDKLAPALATSAFQRPLVLESTQSSGELRGDIYSIVDHPFNQVEDALKGVAVWCDVLILHLNVKHCQAGQSAQGSTVALSLGKKHDQPLADAYKVNFIYQLGAATPDYLRVQLGAKEGPLGTSNYRILFEATPLDAWRSFLHMSYAYEYGFAGRMAMQGYLATIGRGKVGFSVVGKTAEGQPVYVDNVRGVVERNTMRYYLAIDVYLGALSLPPAQQQEKRLHDWFMATEKWPRQLHELDEADYLAMKRKEIARQGS